MTGESPPLDCLGVLPALCLDAQGRFAVDVECERVDATLEPLGEPLCEFSWERACSLGGTVAAKGRRP